MFRKSKRLLALLLTLCMMLSLVQVTAYAATSITVGGNSNSTQSVSLEVSSTETVTLSKSGGGNSTSVTIATADSSIASVNTTSASVGSSGSSFTITGVAAGTTTVTVSWTSGGGNNSKTCTATITVTVTAATTQEEEDTGGTYSITTYLLYPTTKTVELNEELSDSAVGMNSAWLLVENNDDTIEIEAYYTNYTYTAATTSGMSAGTYVISNGNYYLCLDENGNLTSSPYSYDAVELTFTASGNGYIISYVYEGTTYYLTVQQTNASTDSDNEDKENSEEGEGSSSNDGKGSDQKAKFRVTSTTDNSKAAVFVYGTYGLYTKTTVDETEYYVYIQMDYQAVYTTTASDGTTQPTNGGGAGGQNASKSGYEAKACVPYTKGESSTTTLNFVVWAYAVYSSAQTLTASIGETYYTFNVTSGIYAYHAAYSSGNFDYTYGWHFAAISEDTTDSSYSADVKDYDTDINTTDHVTLYGSNTSGDDNPTELTQAKTYSTGTDAAGDTTYTYSSTEGYASYSYRYVTITCEAGYYIKSIVLGCNDGLYGSGCDAMGHGEVFSQSIEDIGNSSIEIDMVKVILQHGENGGKGAPYFLLIELGKYDEEGTMYVEYEPGTASDYVSQTIVSANGSEYWATASDSQSVSFGYDYEDSTMPTTEILSPAYTYYTVTDENGDSVTYYFAGWQVEAYSTAEAYEKASSEGEEAEKIYPTMTGYMGGGTISAGEKVTLTYHLKLTATWTTLKPPYFVVDFGLPVTLDLTESLSTVTGSTSFKITKVESVTNYGTAELEQSEDGSTKITFTATTVLQGVEVLKLTVGTDSYNAGNAYISIYPATTVDYEETFATFGSGWTVGSTAETAASDSWTVSTTATSSSQQTEIVTENKETGKDGSSVTYYTTASQDNAELYNYGYDVAYADDAGNSDGTVATTSTSGDSLTFTFTGTGVDIFATCTSETSQVAILLKNSDGSAVALTAVNTAIESGNTAITSYSSIETSYNTPICSYEGLEYGTYTVVIYNTKNATFNFDGFRVYNTLSTSNTIANEIYTVDSEYDPSYTEVRDVVLYGLKVDLSKSDYADQIDTSTTTEESAETSTSAKAALKEYANVYASANVNANALYVSYSSSGSSDSSTSSTINAADLLDNGPKNELYLYPGMTLIVKIDASAFSDSSNLQLGMRTVDGTEVSYKVKVADSESAGLTDVEASTMKSATDMYYTLTTDSNSDVSDTTPEYYYLIVSNTGNSGILSLTNLKLAHGETDEDEDEVLDVTAMLLSLDEEEVYNLLTALYIEETVEVDPDEEVPDLSETDPADPVDPTDEEDYEEKKEAADDAFDFTMTDVGTGDYYYESVFWAVKLGYVAGTSSTTFSPNSDCTRAQIVTFLWRVAGCPDPESMESSFTDVQDSSQYYYKAVLWAVEQGITVGTTSTTFSPNAPCTRAQAVTFLYRYAGGSADSTSCSFTDCKESNYFASINWAVENNITVGTGGNNFSPNTTCSRAHIVCFLYRLLG